MHALFVSLATKPPNLLSPHVYLFDSEQEAEEFALDELIETGQIALSKVGDGFYERPLSNASVPAKDGIEEFHDGLRSSEYFHIYDVTDKRSQEMHNDGRTQNARAT